MPYLKFTLICFSFFCSNLIHSQFQVLHYDETTGFDHQTRAQSFALFSDIGAVHNFTVTQDSDGSSFTIPSLTNYDLVVFSNTSGDGGLNDSQRAALEWFIDVNGGSLMGIHAATDTYRHSTANGNNTGTWDWYAETLGGSVQQNPNHTSSNHVDNINELIEHPCSENIDFPWVKEEEYYYWENGFINPDINQVLQVEETGDSTYDEARPVVWTRTNDAGAKIFYTSLGHKQGNYTGAFPDFEQLIEDAVLWLLEPNVSLAVTLIDFQGSINSNGYPQIWWETGSEINTDYFEVEKSIDAINWNTSTTMQAIGKKDESQRYVFLDNEKIDYSGKYFRLIDYDLNGKKTILKTIHLSPPHAKRLLIFPNPVSSELSIILHEKMNGFLITLFNKELKAVYESQVLTGPEIRINMQELEPGIYYVLLVDSLTGERHAFQKLVKL